MVVRQSVTIVALSALVSLCIALAGCALFKDRATIEQVTETPKVVEHSISVLQCASFMQRIAFDSGKRLSTEAAIAFCAALEASPDVKVALTPGADS